MYKDLQRSLLLSYITKKQTLLHTSYVKKLINVRHGHGLDFA